MISQSERFRDRKDNGERKTKIAGRGHQRAHLGRDQSAHSSTHPQRKGKAKDQEQRVWLESNFIRTAESRKNRKDSIRKTHERRPSFDLKNGACSRGEDCAMLASPRTVGISKVTGVRWEMIAHLSTHKEVIVLEAQEWKPRKHGTSTKIGHCEH